jgi:hypothetical protein
MTSHDDLTEQHYTVEADWQATTRVRAHVRRITDARESPNEPLFDAAAQRLLCLDAKPFQRVSHVGYLTFVLPYDSSDGTSSSGHPTTRQSRRSRGVHHGSVRLAAPNQRWEVLHIDRLSAPMTRRCSDATSTRSNSGANAA